MKTLLSEFEMFFHDYETLLRPGAFYTLSNQFDNPKAKLLKSELILEPGTNSHFKIMTICTLEAWLSTNNQVTYNRPS